MSELAGNVWDDVPEWGGGVGARRLVRADGEETARVLIVAASANPDVAEYDSGKLAAIVDGDHRFFGTGDAVEHGGPE